MNNHYKYGIISDSNIKLFDESTISSSLLSSEFLEDVDVDIKDNGVLYINANRIEYDLYMFDGERIFEDEWKRTPESKLIKTGKRWFWSKTKERYVDRGWVRTIERTPVQYILNKYKIEILK